MFKPPAGTILWLTFFTICFGLGYPTVNRYDPRVTGGTSDSRQYFRMVTDGPSAAEGHWRYRVLVPYLAKPIYQMAAGRLGTWNPIAFSLLIVNAAFCASSGLLLILAAQAFGFSAATGLIAAFSYLLNFDVANFQLAGLVDSAEGFLLIALLLALQKQAWSILPVLGVVGGLAKETFVPIAFFFACGWVWCSVRRRDRKPWIAIGGGALAGIAVVVLIRTVVEGRLITPWEIAIGERLVAGLPEIFRATLVPLASWTTWISFIWLLPFAFLGIKRLPHELVAGTLLALTATLVLVIWNASGSNASRPFFHVAGPCLCLAFAAGISDTAVTE